MSCPAQPAVGVSGGSLEARLVVALGRRASCPPAEAGSWVNIARSRRIGQEILDQTSLRCCANCQGLGSSEAAGRGG